MAQNSRPCDGCGSAVPRTKPTGPISPYCDDGCKPRCALEGCEAARFSRGWCVFHYTRWKNGGSPEAPLVRRKNAGLRCAIDGCEQPSRKLGWCASHYAQAHRTGNAQPFGYKWADPRPCKVCEKPPGDGYREFCSGACRALWVFHDGNVPTEKPCLGCGAAIDLTARGKGGQRIHSVIVFCKRCKGEFNKYALTTQQLAERDGTDCGICGDPVDMDLRRYESDGLMCASVDHILPRARGGTHDADNLQLAHLRCNMVKSDRVAPEVA